MIRRTRSSQEEPPLVISRRQLYEARPLSTPNYYLVFHNNALDFISHLSRNQRLVLDVILMNLKNGSNAVRIEYDDIAQKLKEIGQPIAKNHISTHIVALIKIGIIRKKRYGETVLIAINPHLFWCGHTDKCQKLIEDEPDWPTSPRVSQSTVSNRQREPG